MLSLATDPTLTATQRLNPGGIVVCAVVLVQRRG